MPNPENTLHHFKYLDPNLPELFDYEVHSLQQVAVPLTPALPSFDPQNHPDDPELPVEKVPQIILFHQFDPEFDT